MKKKIFSTLLTLITVINISCLAQKSEKQVKIIISTTYGDIKLALYNETPKHRDNFIKLVTEGFYNNTLFHRIIQEFMIQGGDPDSKNAANGVPLGEGDVGYTIPAEFNTTLFHKKGALAAARQGDDVNPKKESSGCQFYIVQGKKYNKEELDKMTKRTGNTYAEGQYKVYETEGGTPQLDMNYTVFGEVLEGFEVIDKIAAVEKDRNDRPKEDIKMTIKIVKK
ncbi:MAG: peptidylprolyl isomerase [Bacteroidetes bacterium RIFCSPLOWO2_12_FULL_31_6]|nr:MAG: peptidylprolyl isomerase [Bacteroidetes bacterium RIFCSPLOWO2_12_FULL_31_6]